MLADNALTGWLSQKARVLANWLPNWAGGGGGAPGPGAPRATGAPVSREQRPAAVLTRTRTEVGGELRIVVDAQGRSKVAQMRRQGPVDFALESGVLGAAS